MPGHHSLVASFEFSLPPSPGSASLARAELDRCLDGWGDDEARDTVTLLLSELVTNAVLHARSEVTVNLDVEGGRLRVQVRDTSSEALVRRDPGADIPGGRGLQLLDMLAENWGVSAAGAGKTVWFELWSPRSGQTPKAGRSG
ncbi:MAG: ATP-binding protein [Propionibacteriales bacterium]|nr:ATP-binding protein [Propionibacteriales bacterium]